MFGDTGDVGGVCSCSWKCCLVILVLLFVGVAIDCGCAALCGGADVARVAVVCPSWWCNWCLLVLLVLYVAAVCVAGVVVSAVGVDCVDDVAVGFVELLLVRCCWSRSCLCCCGLSLFAVVCCCWCRCCLMVWLVYLLVSLFVVVVRCWRLLLCWCGCSLLVLLFVVVVCCCVLFASLFAGVVGVVGVVVC